MFLAYDKNEPGQHLFTTRKPLFHDLYDPVHSLLDNHDPEGGENRVSAMYFVSKGDKIFM